MTLGHRYRRPAERKKTIVPVTSDGIKCKRQVKLKTCIEHSKISRRNVHLTCRQMRFPETTDEEEWRQNIADNSLKTLTIHHPVSWNGDLKPATIKKSRKPQSSEMSEKPTEHLAWAVTQRDTTPTVTTTRKPGLNKITRTTKCKDSAIYRIGCRLYLKNKTNNRRGGFHRQQISWKHFC